MYLRNKYKIVYNKERSRLQQREDERISEIFWKKKGWVYSECGGVMCSRWITSPTLYYIIDQDTKVCDKNKSIKPIHPYQGPCKIYANNLKTFNFIPIAVNDQVKKEIFTYISTDVSLHIPIKMTPTLAAFPEDFIKTAHHTFSTFSSISLDCCELVGKEMVKGLMQV